MSAILPINIEDLLRTRGVESARVEFKESWNEGPTALQVLQTLSAFANDFQNLNGGYIVLGVRAHDGAAEFPPAGLDPADLEAIQVWIRGRCNTLDPPYQPILSPEVIEGRHILVIWAPGSDTRPHQAPASLQKGSEKKFFVRLGAQTIEAKKELLTQLLSLTAKVPFDDRRAGEIPIEKIREQRVREFLSDVQSALLDEPDAREIYRRMLITARVNAHEVPRNVGLLFFAEDPQEWFRGAYIEVAQFAAGAPGNVMEERAFRGPLPQQLRDSINYLRSLLTSHLEKLPDRPEVKRWVSYPVAALEETLVNAVYHRSYESQPEPIKVYIYPDRVEVTSYPGPVPGIEPEHFRRGARVPAVPARNRRIGELLKELRLAESRGTGIPKIYLAMEQNGSPEPQFQFDTGRTYFQVTLPAHPQYVVIAAIRDAAHLRAIGDAPGAIARIRAALDENPQSETLKSMLAWLSSPEK